MGLRHLTPQRIFALPRAVAILLVPRRRACLSSGGAVFFLEIGWSWTEIVDM